MAIETLPDLNLDSDPDKDMFQEDVKQVFPHHYTLHEHLSVGLDNTYVLHLSVNSGKSLLGAALSNGSVSVLDAAELTKKDSFKAHTETISGLRFSPSNENLIYTSSLDGCVKLWDLRQTEKPSMTFNSSSDGNSGKSKRPLTAFDVSADGRFVCAGTEQVSRDTFLLFWDARGGGDIAGGYWESHEDDITDVRFHPTDPNVLASGATDGIVNVFDISKANEDEALTTSTNTESSVQKLKWFKMADKMADKMAGSDKNLAVILHTEEVQLWHVDDYGPYKTYSRDDVTIGIKRRATEMCYVVDCLQANEGGVLMLVGSGCPTAPCLRMVEVGKKNRLKPFADLSSKKVRNTLVRASIFNETNGDLYVGGEDGVISLWKEGPENETAKKSGKAKKKKEKTGPY